MAGRPIDHTPIVVADLALAREQYRRLGFKLMPIGYHTGRSTANHIILFEQGFTEIVGLIDPARHDPVIDDILRAREGISLIAFLSEDTTADREVMTAGALSVGEVMNLERPVEISGYSGIARFRLLLLETPEHPLVQLFLTEHLTPEVTRFPEYLIHPNDALGIQSVTIVADNPESLRVVFETCIGVDPFVEPDGALVFAAGRSTVEIIATGSLGERFPGYEVERQRPYVLGQCLSVGYIPQTMACLAHGRITFRQESDGVVTVAPEDACGVLLQFRQQPD